ncbi:hypothetical protein HY642_02505 [Candidatus Woesearchaeota archaeon]|nr:hypothetical protein [Candidatus Woesearchaeota archaeon]
MVLETVKQSASELRKTTREKTGLAIAAAFAFVMALSWNEAIKALVDSIASTLNLSGTGLLVKVSIAIITSAICVTGIWYFSKLNKVKK